MKKTIILKESELISLFQKVIEGNKKGDKLLSWYRNKIDGLENELMELEHETEKMKSDFEAVSSFLNPKIKINIIDPEPRQDKGGFKPKQYYKGTSSFPYQGKKNQIAVYITSTDKLNYETNKAELEKMALKAVQKAILKKFPMIEKLVKNMENKMLKDNNI